MTSKIFSSIKKSLVEQNKHRQKVSGARQAERRKQNLKLAVEFEKIKSQQKLERFKSKQKARSGFFTTAVGAFERTSKIIEPRRLISKTPVKRKAVKRRVVRRTVKRAVVRRRRRK